MCFNRGSFAATILSLVVLLAARDSAAAMQANPFARPAPGVQQPVPPPATPAPGPIDEQDPIVVAVLKSNPQTPLELMEAIRVLLNIDRDDLAGSYVQTLIGIDLSDQQLFALYRGVGPDLIFLLGTRAGLAPQGAELADRVFRGAERYSTDQDRVSQLCIQIGDADVVRRSAALADLILLGEQGAATLINALADDSRQNDWPRIRGALRYFKQTAEGPLLGALRSSDPRMQLEATQALGWVPTPSAVESLYRPAFASPDPAIRLTAERSLQRLIGRVPDQSEAEEKLSRSADDYLMDRRLVNGDPEQTISLWTWDESSRQLIRSEVNGRTAARMRAFLLASDLKGLNDRIGDYQDLYWLTRLESTKLVNGIQRPMPDEVVAELAEALDVHVAADLLDEAMRRQRIPAAIAICDFLAVHGHEGLLFSAGPSATPLVKSLGIGAPRLTNAAAKVIFRINPAQPYVGSSQYIDALVQMARSRGKRKALVGHINARQATSLAAMIGQVGYTSSIARTSREFYDNAVSDPDLELLVITDTMDQPGFAELIQALQANVQSRGLPILLLYRQENEDRARRVASEMPRVRAMPLVFDDVLLARQIGSVDAMNNDASSTPAERLAFAAEALQQLEFISQNRDRCGFYNLTGHQHSLMYSLNTPSLANQTCRVLGQIATPIAQRTLVMLASNNGAVEPLRRQAAESFADAVKHRGLLLTHAEILSQYQRYNSSLEEPESNQEILAAILDTIEGRSR